MNPVLQALAKAKLAEQRQHAAAVAEHLQLPAAQGFDAAHWKSWTQFCAAKGVEAYPALPASVAIYILTHTALGAEVVKVVEAVSAVHQGHGAADPTLSPMVVAALNEVDPVAPPRSWDAAARELWKVLPRAVALQIVARDADARAAVKKALNEAAKIRKEHNHGKTEQDSASAASTEPAAGTAEPAITVAA